MKISPLFGLLLLAGCGSIVNGRCQEVAITSTPSNAIVFVDQKFMGRTPLKAKLTRKENHIVTIELPGYQSQEIKLNRQMSAWALGNFVFGGVIGVAVDAISGGLYELSSDAVHAEINRGAVAHMETEQGAALVVVEGADPSWNQVGQLKRF